MRISDWSSVVCSSDLAAARFGFVFLNPAALKGTRLSGEDSRHIRRLWQYAETAASLTLQPGGADGVRDRRGAVPDKESDLQQEGQPIRYRQRVALERCSLHPVDHRSRSEERRGGKEG